MYVGQTQPTDFRPTFLVQPRHLIVTELNSTVRLFWRILSQSCNGCFRVSLETENRDAQNRLLHSWPVADVPVDEYEYNATTTVSDNQNGTSYVDVNLFIFVDENVLRDIQYVLCQFTYKEAYNSELVQIATVASTTTDRNILTTQSTTSSTGRPDQSMTGTNSPSALNSTTSFSSSVTVSISSLIPFSLSVLSVYIQLKYTV